MLEESTKYVYLSQDSESSLVKRLAGPSTGKSGLAEDQRDINRIIAEASKGSKFYDNEKKKDKELTERIARVLAQRDAAVKGVDIAAVEKAVDRILAELEADRDLSQSIVHADMDAFFANVELLHDPTLRGKPFGVGSGVLTTASYEARKFGVRSGMPGFIAKKLCPEIIIVPSHYARYSEMSAKVMAVFARYDPNLCPAGSDEAYLNITTYCEEHTLSAETVVSEMREAVYKETGLTVSAGIAPNKMLAKICSDKNKPNGQYVMPFNRQSIVEFMHDLSIRRVHGIGRVNERLLESIGIKTCGDIYTRRAILSLMDKQFGLVFLLQTHLGIASNVVRPHQREERKSIGVERTFNTITDEKRILEKLSEVAVELENDMEELGWMAKTVTLKFKLDTYQVFTRAKSFTRWVSTKEDLFNTGKELLEFPLRIRLIGLRVTKLKDLKLQPRGIEQFFATRQGETRGHKRKDIEDPRVLSDVENDDDEEAMPGFHEHDENDLSHAVEEEDFPVDAVPQRVESKPRSSAASMASSSRPPQEPSSSPGIPSTELKSTPMLSCPVCDKQLSVDNEGLNSHIDWCLSRGAIREAQSQAKPISPCSQDKTWKWTTKEDTPNKRVKHR